MSQKADGMNYAPSTSAKPKPVVEKGEFIFAAAHLNHGHIYGQCGGLINAGAQLKCFYEPNANLAEKFQAKFPDATRVDSLDAILQDDEIQLVASAAIPNLRGALGCKVMQHGKHYFTDKCPFTTLEQLAEARKVVSETGKRYMVYYSERVHVESAWYAGELIRDGAIGDIVQMSIFGPHRLAKGGRPDWFFDKEQYGGILTDIASHQFDQFLEYAGTTSGEVKYARVANFANPDKPGLEDFGEASLRLAPGKYSQLGGGASCNSRVDWFTPDGMRGWGDGRSFIVGTKGSIEIRKYFDLGRSDVGNRLFIVTHDREEELELSGQVGFPFFGMAILDCLNGTENAMTQEHAFMASELSLKAQQLAEQSGE